MTLTTVQSKVSESTINQLRNKKTIFIIGLSLVILIYDSAKKFPCPPVCGIFQTLEVALAPILVFGFISAVGGLVITLFFSKRNSNSFWLFVSSIIFLILSGLILYGTLYTQGL